MDRAWLRLPRRVDRPAARLVCFAHSGGTASFFRGWTDLLPPDIEPVFVQYPGREERIGEPCVTSVPAMSAAVVAELSILDNAPLLLFGHSLGGAVAYETARTLRRDVLGLFVSARIAPVHRVRTAIHRGTDEEFWAALDALGGTDREITGNPELREVLTPMMRADFEASEFYSVSRGEPRLTCPVVAYVGADDPIVPAGQVADWAELCVDFTFVEFPGDHFYLRARAGELIADMMGRVQLPQRG